MCKMDSKSHFGNIDEYCESVDLISECSAIKPGSKTLVEIVCKPVMVKNQFSSTFYYSTQLTDNPV